MVSAANLLLGANAPPEEIQSPGGAQDQDPPSSPFLAIVQGLMEPAEADPVRAGQQAVEDEQTSDGDEPLRNMTIQGCLLGSVQIACGEVQALPGRVMTDASLAKEAIPSAVESSTSEVAPNPAQPTAVEPPTEAVPADPGLDPGPATAVEAAESSPDLAIPTATPAEHGELPVAQRPRAPLGVEVPVQGAQMSETEIEQPELSVPAPEVVAVQDDPIVGQATPRRQAERPEVAEHLRNVVPQEANRPDGRTIIAPEAQSIRPVTDADFELAAMPVERPEQREVNAFLPRAESSIQWMPIEARPVAETAARPIEVTALRQPVDPSLSPELNSGDRIIHQIVRTARVQVFDGGGEMVMRLEPAHLGSIRMSVTAERGVVAANLRVGSEAVRQALEAGIVTLRQSLADSGIHVDSISVSVGDGLGQGWNLHAGGHNGSQHADGRQSGYPARLLREDGVAVSADQPSASHISAGFNYLA